MFIFVYNSQCASMIVPLAYIPRSEIPWWKGLNNFSRVWPSCPPERAIYSPSSKIGEGSVFVIYKGMLGKFESSQIGTGISLSLWLAQDQQLGIMWNPIICDIEGTPTPLTCLIASSCVISVWAWVVLFRKDRYIWIFKVQGVCPADVFFVDSMCLYGPSLSPEGKLQLHHFVTLRLCQSTYSLEAQFPHQ